MPVQPCQIYVEGQRSVNEQEIDWENDTIQAMLLLEAHTPAINTHKFVTSVQPDEHGATGNYARVNVPATAFIETGNFQGFDCGTIDFGANTTITARYLAIYKLVTNDTDSLLLFLIDLTGGGSESSVNGNFNYTPSVEGLHEYRPNQ